MSFSLQRYLPNLFVAIIIEANMCRLLGRIIKNDTVVKTFETVFENPDEEKIDPKVIKYLQSKESECHNIYIALYLDSIGQGAIAGVEKQDFEKYSVDIKNVSYVTLEQTWSAYASYIDVKWAKNMFEPVSLDLLYSPFIILYHCIKNQKDIKAKPILYIYNHEDSFALGVFENTKLLFGAFFRTKTNEDDIIEDIDMVEDWEEAQEETGIENLVELDNITTEDEMEGFSDLEDLEDIENLDEIDENFDIEEEHENFQKEYDENEADSKHDAASSLELFGRDMKMYKYLTSAIKEFYQDTAYEHTFLDTIVIFDNHNMSDAIKSMIEHELFMEVRVHKVKTLDILCDLAIKDTPL